MNNVLAVVLAGGKGSRNVLTRDRAKPAVPFGGAYRIIDFTLSNCLNSGIRKMLVLTQYKAMSLTGISISVGDVSCAANWANSSTWCRHNMHRRALVPGHGRCRRPEASTRSKKSGPSMSSFLGR